jgi:hypothetical protein
MVDLVQRLQAQTGLSSLMAGLPPASFAPATAPAHVVRAPTSVPAAASLADLGSVSVPSSAVVSVPGVSDVDGAVPAKPATPVIFRVPPPPAVLPPSTTAAAATTALPVVTVTEARLSEDSFKSLETDTDGTSDEPPGSSTTNAAAPVDPSQVEIVITSADGSAASVVAVPGHASVPPAGHALGEVTEL